jgi:hypothetical protein
LKKIGFVLLFGLFLSIYICPAGASAQDLSDTSRYTTENGIDIISYVNTWTGDKLTEIGSELMNNTHGVEMEYLDRIEIHAGKEPGGNESVSASYRKEHQKVSIPVNLSGFLPADYELKVSVNKGIIDIYKGEEKEDIREIAMDLSHEYGHHFSFFYFGNSFTSEEYKDSPYYEMRQLKNYKEVNGESSYEDNIHRWSIFEIAAEDYKELLGSKTGKGVTKFLDISQKTGSQTYQPVNSASRLDYNAIPQENWTIPLAVQVEGLYDYFMSFLGEDAGQSLEAGIPSDSESGQIVVTDSGLAVKLPALTYREEEHHGFRKGIIAWNPLEFLTAEDTDEVIYTLAAFTEDNQLIPIKTVYPGEETSAVIGTVTDIQDPYIYYYQDGLDKGTLHFKLYMQFSSGQVLSSDELAINFDSLPN